MALLPRPNGNTVTVLVVGGLAVICVIAIVSLAIWAPLDRDVLLIGGMVITILAPTIAGIWAGTRADVAATRADVAATRADVAASKSDVAVDRVQQLDVKVDGRLTQLLASREEASVLAQESARQAAMLAAQDTARQLADEVARLTAQVALQSAQAAANVAAQAAATAAAQAAAQTAAQLGALPPPTEPHPPDERMR